MGSYGRYIDAFSSDDRRSRDTYDVDIQLIELLNQPKVEARPAHQCSIDLHHGLDLSKEALVYASLINLPVYSAPTASCHVNGLSSMQPMRPSSASSSKHGKRLTAKAPPPSTSKANITKIHCSSITATARTNDAIQLAAVIKQQEAKITAQASTTVQVSRAGQ